MTGGNPSAWNLAHPQDICPECGHHARWEAVKGPRDGVHSPVTCSECGATVPRCSRLRLTPDERAQSAAKARERRAEWYRANRDRIVEAKRIAAATERGKALASARNRRWRERHRDEVVERQRRRRAERPEENKEYQRRYREGHAQEIFERNKRRKLEALERRKEAGE